MSAEFKSPLAASHALGGQQPLVTRAGPFTMSEVTDLSIASLALDHDGDPTLAFGFALPEPGRWSGSDGTSALWIGPNQWLVFSETGAGQNLMRQFTKACPAALVTDQTDAWVTLDITWEDDWVFPELAARLSNIAPSRLLEGLGTRSLVHHMSCHLVRCAEHRLRILGMRSMAGSLRHALETIGTNLQGQVRP
jgi:sarcosine oxidase subunit gamma